MLRNSQNLDAVLDSQAGELGLVARNDSAHQDPAPHTFPGKRPAGPMPCATPSAQATRLGGGGCRAGSVRRQGPSAARPRSYPIAAEAVVGPSAALWASLVLSRATAN